MARQWFIILQGPNKGTEIDLIEDEIVVGRHPDCDVNINDPEVSRKHFVIRKKNGEYWIEDLGSMNRTVINGRPISGTYRLRNNSRISIGANVTLGFRKEDLKPVEQRTQPSKVEVVEKKKQPPISKPPKKKEQSIEEQPLVEEQPPVMKRPKKREKAVKQEEKRKTNWFAWGCFGFLLILVLAAVAALYYIDANFLWCDIFGEWLPGCY